MNNLANYIKNKRLNNYNINGIAVTEQQTDSDTDFRYAIVNSFKMVPKHFLTNIKKINIGLTKEMKERDIEGYYKDGVIYVTHQVDNEEDFMDNLIHEIAHAVEENYDNKIYLDGTVEKEFIQKRKKLFEKLKQQNYSPDYSKFINPKYEQSFDLYLYKEVGYKKLWSIIGNIFYSPYAATSLREYFANAFEAIFYKNKVSEIKSLCPVLYAKIEEITNENRKREVPEFT